MKIYMTILKGVAIALGLTAVGLLAINIITILTN